MNITSSIALVIYTVVMFIAYLPTIWFGQLPFLVFAPHFTIAFVAYLTKRIHQKKKEYNNE